jgi:hypothetical protein
MSQSWLNIVSVVFASKQHYQLHDLRTSQCRYIWFITLILSRTFEVKSPLFIQCTTHCLSDYNALSDVLIQHRHVPRHVDSYQLGIAVHDKYGLLIEAPGHTESSFIGNNRKKNDRSRKTSLHNAHINNHRTGSEGCAECILFPGLVNSALTQKTDKPTADTVPRSLISVAYDEDMATLAARTEWLEAELKEARRIAAKKKPIKKRNPRRKYDKEVPPSITLQDWVFTAPNNELFGF